MVAAVPAGKSEIHCHMSLVLDGQERLLFIAAEREPLLFVALELKGQVEELLDNLGVPRGSK